MEFYNTQMPHSAPDRSTPTDAYQKGLLMEIQAEPPACPSLPVQPERVDMLNGSLAA